MEQSCRVREDRRDRDCLTDRADRDRLTDRADRDRLTDLFRCFLSGTRPELGAAAAARVILSGLSGPDRDQDSLDRSCISLSLVDKMSCSLTRSPEDRNRNPADRTFSCFCREVLTVLLQDLDLMAELVKLFQNRDRILSHLAAKTAASCVVYLLLTWGSVSAAWQQMLVQTFYSSEPGPGSGLDPCLWSLTEVLKRLLRGNHEDQVSRLLAEVDSSLCALVPRLLPEQTGSQWRTSCCLLLDLLELLTASASSSARPGGAGSCGGGVQRLTHTHCSALLDSISCCSQASVRRRTLLLLKRVLLQRAGEDWTGGERRAAGSSGSSGSSQCDGRTVARCVLAAVDSGWLLKVQVDSDSYFGGTRQVRGGGVQRPDRVVLRAVSLVLLKSIELDLQAAGVTGPTQVSRYLQQLQVFLRLTGGHRCSWISQLFSDQDDDMMEAAKALLEIHLHHRRRSAQDVPPGSSCSSGSDPHCHFLLLLHSVSFDHRVLLDFLISTETCFLEYFVRYLKHLRGDAQGFTAACRRISCGGAAVGGAGEGVGGVVHLVDYGSSEDSDSEDMEVCEDAAGGRGDGGSGVSPAAAQVSRGASARALRCLVELRDVVTRLQVKNLFPYNPTSLLRLLDQVTCLVSPGTGGYLRDTWDT